MLPFYLSLKIKIKSLIKRYRNIKNNSLKKTLTKALNKLKKYIIISNNNPKLLYAIILDPKRKFNAIN